MKKQLREKIVELFEYRRLPELIKLGNNGKADVDLLEKLIQLQADIYHLDHTLESNWEADEKKLSEHWKDIHSSLVKLEVKPTELDHYSRHIYKYQKHELELRQKKYPTRLSMEYFYFYKSCDVKLLRKLIYDHYPNLGQHMNLAHWRVFDLITEINDDVEDVFEDLETINGNRFLLTIMLEGKSEAKNVFRRYLSSLEGRLTGYGTVIDKMTADVYRSTKKLLKDRLKTVKETEVQKAEIAKYILVKPQSIDY